MPSRSARWSVLSFGWLAVACGGGGGGGGTPPQTPNSPPVLTVPAGVGGSSPRYTVLLPAGGTATFEFTATDPDQDSLLWQFVVPPDLAAAVGVTFVTPIVGNAFALQLAPVAAAAATTSALVVEDGNNGVAAIDLLLVRTGPPTILGVAPDTAFATLPQTVTITGSALQLGGAVATTAGFDGLPASQVVVASDSKLTCRTPAAALPGPTIVGVGHQYGVATLPDSAFTLLPFPPVLATNDQGLGTASGTFAFAADGPRLHVLWEKPQGPAEVLSHRASNDGGATWTAAQPVAGPGSDPASPQLAVLGDAVTALWIDQGNRVLCSTSADGGGTWAPELPVSAPAPPVVPRSRPRLGASGNRRLAVWIEGDAGLGTARLRASASSDGGLSWTPPAFVADGGANQGEHELVLAGNVAIVVCTDDRLGAAQRGVLAVRSIDGGASWGPARRLNLVGTAGGSPRLCAADGRAHACWLEGGALFYNGSNDHGASWSNAVTPVQNALAGALSGPAIAAAGDRVWFGYVQGGTRTWASRMTPLGSTPQHTQLEDEATASADLVLAAVGDYVYAAWREGDVGAGTARLQLSVSGDGGGTFSAAAGFGDGTAAQRAPQLCPDGARLRFAWLDERAGPTGLFTNRTVP